MADYGREIVTIVELDFDYCQLESGTTPPVGAFGADGLSCFNTRESLEGITNFTLATMTLRFGHNQDGLPKGTTVYPALRAISTSALRINPNGIDSTYGALGKRERITISLQDFEDNDTYTDNYYDTDPFEAQSKGTFFTKLRARNPFWAGRAIRVLDGTAGQDLSAMRSREYVISEWVGPDADGRVTITAKDIFDLVENEKAVAPAQSQGLLESDVSTGLVSFDLEPSGIGSDYAASGRASIGGEIVTFTRSSDTITLTGRGVDGTDEESHAQGDTFQQCYRVEGVHVLDVIADLIENYTSVSSSYIPADLWASERIWVAGFDLTCTIAKPTGVKDLLAEICQLGLMPWWDPVDKEIKIKAVRPSGYDETLQAVSDEGTIIEKSLGIKDLPEQRLSRVRIYHGITDAAAGVSDEANYDVCEIRIEPEAEANAQHAVIQEKVIFMRWLGVGQTSIVGAVASRLISRYRDTPRELTMSADYKDRSKLPLSGLLTVDSRLLVDVTGTRSPTSMQVVSSEEVQPGHEIKITAQTFTYDGRFGFVMQDSANDYDNATDDEKNRGCYVVNSGLLFSDNSSAYEAF